MFGGWGLYSGELFVALIADDELYVKVDDQTRPAFEAAHCQPFVFEAKGKRTTMGFWTVPAEALDSAALMQSWAVLAAQAALRARSARAVPASRKTKVVKASKARKVAQPRKRLQRPQ